MNWAWPVFRAATGYSHTSACTFACASLPHAGRAALSCLIQCITVAASAGRQAAAGCGRQGAHDHRAAAAQGTWRRPALDACLQCRAVPCLTCSLPSAAGRPWAPGCTSTCCVCYGPSLAGDGDGPVQDVCGPPAGLAGADADRRWGWGRVGGVGGGWGARVLGALPGLSFCLVG